MQSLLEEAGVIRNAQETFVLCIEVCIYEKMTQISVQVSFILKSKY